MEFEFAKNETVEAIDKVPEQFRGFYAQGENGFAINEAFKPTAQSIDGLNKSLKAARRDAAEALKNRPDVSQYGELGQLLGLEENPTDPVALKEALEKTLRQSKDGQVNWDKMKGTLEQGFKTQLSAKDQELQTMGTTLQKYLVNSAAISAIAANKGVPEILLPHIQAKTKVIKEGDEYVVRVIDDSGDPRGNNSGGFMSVEELVKELKASPVFGRAFDSETQQGSGTKPGAGQVKAPPRQGELSANEKIAAGLAKRR